MSKLLMNLRHVPEDEADDVRAMLDTHRIAWYETKPGLLGISLGAIWIKHDQDAAQAKQLMAQYQVERQARMRAAHRAAVEDGTAETFLGLLRARPGWVLVRVLGIVFMLGLIALPVYLLSQ